MPIFNYEFQSDFARRKLAEAEAEGEARAVLTVLDARGVEVPEDARATITSCKDLDQLGTWIRLAVTAHKIEDLGLNAAAA